ncbi:MAG: 50S ribosomal protein L15 [Chloroflexota bacterium]
MRLHDLKPAPGSFKTTKRLGRGSSSGQGTTAGKGTKGQKARAGGTKAGFRGMSSRNARLAHRRGFNNKFKVTYQPLNLARLARFESGAQVDVTSLVSAGLVHKNKGPVKILGDGDLTVALHLVGLKVSGSARTKIEGAGGTITAIQETSGDTSSV